MAGLEESRENKSKSRCRPVTPNALKVNLFYHTRCTSFALRPRLCGCTDTRTHFVFVFSLEGFESDSRNASSHLKTPVCVS